MNSDANLSLVRQYYLDVVARGDFSNIGAFLGANYLDHNAPSEQGPCSARAHLEAIRRTFPDFRVQIEDIIASGDKVVTRVTGQGTHLGEWASIKPSGAVIHLKGINIDRVENGRIVEHWGEADTISMLQQMGVNPFGG